MGASVGDAGELFGLMDVLSASLLVLVSSVLGISGELGMVRGVSEGGALALVSSVEEFSGSH